MSMPFDCTVIFWGKIVLVRCQCAFGLRRLAQSAANFASGSFFRGRRNSLKTSAKHSPMFMKVRVRSLGPSIFRWFFSHRRAFCAMSIHITRHFCDAPPRRGIFSNFSRRMTLCEFLIIFVTLRISIPRAKQRAVLRRWKKGCRVRSGLCVSPLLHAGVMLLTLTTDTPPQLKLAVFIALGQLLAVGWHFGQISLS